MQRRALLATPAALLLGGMARPPALDLPVCRGGLNQANAAPGDPEFDYLERLGLLEGHLLIGRRLLENNQSRLAVPHFGHPIRELYTWLEPRIAAHGSVQFERELDAMESYAERGGTGTGGVFAQAWDSLWPKLAAARAGVPATLRGNARFMLEHAAIMLYDISSDYGESIERGRIVNVVEYHDSMGFLTYTINTATVEQARGPAAAEWAEVATVLEEVRSIFYPELLPPSRPPQSISSLRGRYDRVRAIAARVSA